MHRDNVMQTRTLLIERNKLSNKKQQTVIKLQLKRKYRNYHQIM